MPACRVTLLDADVTAPELELPDADVVIHLAGKLNSFNGPPEEIERVNHGGTINLARKLARRGGQAHFVFLSTDQVFRSDAARVYTEEDPVAPETAYGRAKANAEAFLLSTLDRVTILRTAVLHGYSHPRRRNTVEFIESKLRAGERIELYRDVFACPTFIGDLTDCVRRVLAEGVLGVHHACGPEYVSRCDIAEALCAARGYDRGLIHPIARPDTSNIPRYLHLRPSEAFEDLLTSHLGDTLVRPAHAGAAVPLQTALP
jgi:dTDP-4-dehydrorhamnose reductase